MAGSALVAVRQAVIDGLRDAIADDRISVTYGWQGDDDTATREQIFTNGGRATHDPSGMRPGRNFRNEEMEFDIVVLVLGVGQKPDEADQRALDLGVVVEEFIADHKSGKGLDVEGLNWIRMTTFQLSPTRIGANGSISEATYTVRYQARLT